MAEYRVPNEYPQGKEVLIGFNRDEGSFMLLSKGRPESFGPGKTKLDRLDERVFEGWVQQIIPESKDEKMMRRIRRHYFRNENIGGLIDVITDSAFKCDIVDVAKSMSTHGDDKVFMYRFDEALDFADAAYPFLGATHALELLPLFGRPYVDEDIYSDSERLLSAFMMDYWGSFAKGEMREWVSPKRGALSISGDGFSSSGPRMLDMEKCEFLGCLEDLQRMDDGIAPMDLGCMRFFNSAGGRKAGFLSIAAALVLVLSALSLQLQ